MKSLAIVIPAYKEKYFDKALASLKAQTNKDFTVYIGDDASPYDLKKISDRYSAELDIRYTRFENNIGAKYLVKQWSRCIELSKGEEWIWLFSDDDIADKTCVENFLSTLSQNRGFELYRFNTEVINDADHVIWRTPESPVEESSEEMAYHLLLGQRGNSMPDHIFSRKVYFENGGFVFTEYAQGADWATSILFSRKKGIGIIPHAKLYWRFGGFNISSLAEQRKNEMLRGHLQFIEWVVKHFEYLKTVPASTISYAMILYAARENLKSVIVHHYKGLNARGLYRTMNVMRRQLRLTPKEMVRDLLIIEVNTNQFFKTLFRFVKFFKK